MSVSFVGCGTNAIYQAGVAKFMQENYDIDQVRVIGTSGGSIIATLLKTGYDFSAFCCGCDKIFSNVRSSFLGRANGQYYMIESLEQHLVSLENKQVEKLKGNLLIGITTAKLKNFLIDSYETLGDIRNAVRVSTYVPILFYNGHPFYNYEGKIFIGMDGGITNNSPIIDENTIVVCPFGNDYKNPTIGGCLSLFSGISIYDEKSIKLLFDRGYGDAMLKKDIMDRLLPARIK